MVKLIAQTAGTWEGEAAAPGSYAWLGDGASRSSIVGHAHGAQIPEAQTRTELQTLEGAQDVRQRGLRQGAAGRFISRSVPRQR